MVKRMLRTGWQILGDNDESLGEHTFMTAVIAYFLAKEIARGDPAKMPNMEKVLTMALFHDFHEGRVGEVDKIALQYVTRDIGKANKDIFEDINTEVLQLLEEYEEKKSAEARVVYEANIITLLVELKQLVERGNIHAQEWLVGNVKRLRLPEAKALAKEIINSSSQDWWKDIRDKLHGEFTR